MQVIDISRIRRTPNDSGHFYRPATVIAYRNGRRRRAVIMQCIGTALITGAVLGLYLLLVWPE